MLPQHELHGFYSIEQLILSNNPSVSQLALSVLDQLLRPLQETNPAAAANIMQANLPAVLLVIQADPGTDQTHHAAQLKGLKFIFSFFASADSHQQEQLMSLFFDSLLFLVGPARASSPVGRAWAQGLTHFARLAPAAFKHEVAKLDVEGRTNLQKVMQEVLSAQQTSQQPAALGRVNPPKLDASKFKRGGS